MQRLIAKFNAFHNIIIDGRKIGYWWMKYLTNNAIFCYLMVKHWNLNQWHVVNDKIINLTKINGVRTPALSVESTKCVSPLLIESFLFVFLWVNINFSTMKFLFRLQLSKKWPCIGKIETSCTLDPILEYEKIIQNMKKNKQNFTFDELEQKLRSIWLARSYLRWRKKTLSIWIIFKLNSRKKGA